MKNVELLKLWCLIVLSILGVTFPVVIIFYLMNGGLKTMDKETILLIGALIGVIVGEYKTVYNYWLGSSSGSKNKQDTIDKMAASPVPVVDMEAKKKEWQLLVDSQKTTLTFEEWLKTQA